MFAGKLKAVVTSPSAVILKVDGQVVEPVDENGRGVYVYTVDFADLLARWQEQHLPAAQPDAATNEQSDADATDTGDPSDDTQAESQ